MKVAFLPLAPRSGITVSALMTGMALAFKQSKTVRLCYTGTNPAIKRYIGVTEEEADITRSISQVAKLLQAHAISPEELSNYSIKIGPNIDMLDSYSVSLTEDELNEIIQFVYERSTTDFTFCDLCYSWDDELTQLILKMSDVVVFVCEPTWASLSRVVEFNENFRERYAPDAKCILLVNRYDDGVAPLKWCSKTAGMTLRDTCKLHYNPWIIKFTNERKLKNVALGAFEKDPRVCELCQDMKEMTQFLMSLKGEKTKWED